MTSDESLLHEVVVLAGGQGTRLRSRTGPKPKPLAEIAGLSVLEHQMVLCKRHDFERILLLVHYEHEQIRERLGDGSSFGLKIEYHVEVQPRGTAGALRDALHLVAPRFLVLYGDTYLDVDLRRFWQAHERNLADATLFLHPNDHPHDSDLVTVAPDRRVLAIHPCPHPERLVARNLVNAALYMFQRQGLGELIPADGKSDIAKHLFPSMLTAGRHLSAYVSPEYIKDMGTPDRLDKVARDIDSGLVDWLSARRLRRAVFLDRDGTLIEEVGHLRRPDQVKLLPQAGEAVRRLNRSGYLAVVATNQPVLARGEVDWDGMERIHAEMDVQLGHAGAYVDAVQVCPHHPDRGFPGEVPSLKGPCACRKPATGLIDAACSDLQIDRSLSWIVGDSTVDIEAGRRAGLRTVLVRTGHAGLDDRLPVRPHFVAADLPDAVDWILDGHAMACAALLPVLERASRARLILVGGLARSGKSHLAEVLRQLLEQIGRPSHVVCLDAWLRPGPQRVEGRGVASRYDQSTIDGHVDRLLRATGRSTLSLPVHDPIARRPLTHCVPISVGPRDTVIIEGVTALLPSPWRDSADLRLFVDVSDAERRRRLVREYRWRGVAATEIERRIESRESDETPIVSTSRSAAHYVVPTS
jgi:histidinol-phosphate phosphatase family protein